MSELPDLPPAPRWDVAPVTDGASGARATGRRRLRRAAVGSLAALALVASAAVALPQLTGGGGADSLVADDAPTASPNPATDPVLLGDMTDPTTVELCLDGGDCRTIEEGEQALWLRDALSTALPAEPDQVYCEALGLGYSLQFRAGVTVAPQVVVRTRCGPASSAGQDYVVDPLVVDRVERAHQDGVVEPPAFPRGATRLEICHGDVGQRSCSGPGRSRLDEFAALLSAGGTTLRLGEICSASQSTARIQVDYPDGRQVTATAGVECGPLELSDGRRSAVTHRARTMLLAAARTSPAPPAASPGTVAQTTQPPLDGTTSCEFRDASGPAYGSPPPARDVGRPPAEAEAAARRVVLVTNRGEIGLDLDGTRAPCTAHNLAWLGERGYYDDTTCHRVTTEGIFVVQCGDPSGTGGGGPGYEFDDEALDGATYPRGTLAMANAGPGTNGSQFFMVWDDTQLPPNYTVFGRVDEPGLAVLDEVAAGGTTDGQGDGRPKLALTITDVRPG